MLAFAVSLSAQQPFSSLPIVIIATDNDPSTAEPSHMPVNDTAKTGATMKIIYADDAATYSLADTNNPALLNYNGRIGIKTRGHTSLNSNKKSYSIETRKADNITNNNVPLMGMPKENDWVLSALYLDNSHIRDALTYTLGRRTGRYAPRTHHCELFLNGTYQGIYMLVEKIKVDKNRVNIKKISATDTCGEPLTGGYIFKADHPDDNEPMAWTTTSHSRDYDVIYIHHYPKPEEITQQQHEYLYDYFSHFQNSLRYHDTTYALSYPSFIDIPSFIDYMLVCELASNPDSYQYSTFFHKDRNGKLRAGPLWDFNLAYGNDSRGRGGYDVWQFDNGSNTGSSFWYALFKLNNFRYRLETRWHQLTDNGPLALESTLALIDSLAYTVEEAAQRDRTRWNYCSDFGQSIDSLKTWIANRYAWLDLQLNLFTDISSPSIAKPLVYPNPTDGPIHFALPQRAYTSDRINVDIYNSIGCKVMSFSSAEHLFSEDISPLPAGLYTLLLSDCNGLLYRQIVVKQ